MGIPIGAAFTGMNEDYSIEIGNYESLPSPIKNSDSSFFTPIVFTQVFEESILTHLIIIN